MKTVRNKILVIVYGISAVAVLINLIIQENWGKMGYLALACITPFALPVGLKLLGWKSNEDINFVETCFCYVAMMIGNLWGGYGIVGFDKFLHTASGILITTGMMMIYAALRKKIRYSKEELPIVVLFINGLNMMVAFLWECFEFAVLVFLNIDAINHFTSGVYDTMTDMIVCFIGGILTTVILLRRFVKGKKSLLSNAVEKFYTDNIS